ncbi:hypothetical protein LPJ73_001175 [Coemansia sp. RSA 2703]|nr:hypothetical protein LPJ73_001175 [Coemansia sp. RSA 2703]KAJ2375815.1 hypothetical protein IW150_002338 [Coemansia sp. RSA 2607]KAJ2397214.1 hypothetical protein GGI05_000753 [Coemansia sp. RSA 2603]
MAGSINSANDNTMAPTSAVPTPPADDKNQINETNKINWTTAVLMVLAVVSSTAVIGTNALFIAYDASLHPSDQMYNSYAYPKYRTAIRIITIIAYVANIIWLIFDNKYHIVNRETCKAYGIMRIGIATAVACLIVTDPLSEMSWQDVQLRSNVDGSVTLAITLSLVALTVLWILIVRCFRWKEKEYPKYNKKEA